MCDKDDTLNSVRTTYYNICVVLYAHASDYRRTDGDDFLANISKKKTSVKEFYLKNLRCRYCSGEQ